MIAAVEEIFADTGYWIALAVRQDQYRESARKWSLHIRGRIVTTAAVLLETANALGGRPHTRTECVRLIDRVRRGVDVRIVDVTADLWDRGWELYRNRMDKGWSLTDCMSFLVMEDAGIVSALTPDQHFRQAGFRALMLEEP